MAPSTAVCGTIEKTSGYDLRPSGEHLIADRRADSGPEHVGSREIADRFHQRDQRRSGKLCRNDLGHSVIEHLSGEREPHEQANPFLEGGVVRSPTVDDRPDRRQDEGDDEQPSGLNPMERCVSAIARVDEGLGDMEQMRRKPERDLAHRPARPQVWERSIGNEQQSTDDLRGEGIQHEVHETETEGHPRRGIPRRHLQYVLDSPRAGSRGHPVWIVIVNNVDYRILSLYDPRH